MPVHRPKGDPAACPDAAATGQWSDTTGYWRKVTGNVMETGVFRVIFHSLTPFEELLLPLVGFFKLPDVP